ncbi:MAG: hypothetical protein AABY15_01505 [Nanoarchaeota archaeon]
MNNCIKISGTILFDPDNVTNKHERQGEWKKVAVVLIPGDIHLYYSWFIKKRYNLPLNPPLRGAHVTFINDRAKDMNGKWDEVKKKWNGRQIDIILDVDPRSDGLNWWFNVPNECRDELHHMRKELGLDRPFFGLHMTLGTAVNSYPRIDGGINAQRAMGMNEEHSMYILNLIKNGYSN